jgi:pimeloyl-[acyl-carrier protein] methyl ester esterase
VAYPVDRPLGYVELEGLVRAALPTGRPYVMLGESFSGPIAIRVAADAPAGMVGVVLCVTFAKPEVIRATASVDEAVSRHRIAAVLRVDQTSALARIQLPTLVLRAADDHVVPRAASEHVLETLPSAELAEIEGPHLLLQMRPAECAAAVMRFLAGL